MDTKEQDPTPLDHRSLTRLGFSYQYTEYKNAKYSNNDMELWGNVEDGFKLMNGEDRIHWTKSFKTVGQLRELIRVLTDKII